MTQHYKFLSYASNSVFWRNVDKSDWSQDEVTQYDEGLEMLQKFEKTKEFVDQIGALKKEFEALYTEVTRESGVPVVFGRSEVRDR